MIITSNGKLSDMNIEYKEYTAETKKVQFDFIYFLFLKTDVIHLPGIPLQDHLGVIYPQDTGVLGIFSIVLNINFLMMSSLLVCPSSIWDTWK